METGGDAGARLLREGVVGFQGWNEAMGWADEL